MANNKINLKPVFEDIDIRSVKAPDYDIYDEKIIEKQYELFLQYGKNPKEKIENEQK